jgi:arabinose-5-phosphate isomerase
MTERAETVLARARDVLDLEIRGLQDVRDRLDAAFAQAVEIFQSCLAGNGKIVVTGIGKNLHIAQKVSATLASTGATSVVLNPMQAMHGDLGILSPADAVLAFSYSGESDELLALLPALKREAVPIVAVTGAADSTLARNANATIVAAVAREACPFNLAPTASTTAALAVGDALAMTLLHARGFKREDYAKLHPGGTIGRTLLLRVSDIMRTDDRVARVARESRVRDAVLAMTRARAGSAAVVEPDGRLAGIFTDGDLRRRLMEDAAVLDQPIDAVMTPSPVTVAVDQLAVDVLHLFESHRIDDILVTDADGRLVGAIDVQDLPRLKIV